ncbi:unnamed protein product, partial [Meganyctiphanes norvegica]
VLFIVCYLMMANLVLSVPVTDRTDLLSAKDTQDLNINLLQKNGEMGIEVYDKKSQKQIPSSPLSRNVSGNVLTAVMPEISSFGTSSLRVIHAERLDNGNLVLVVNFTGGYDFIMLKMAQTNA